MGIKTPKTPAMNNSAQPFRPLDLKKKYAGLFQSERNSNVQRLIPPYKRIKVEQRKSWGAGMLKAPGSGFHLVSINGQNESSVPVTPGRERKSVLLRA